MRAARVVARQAHRLHHSLGSRHVKRHFVEAGDFAQPPRIVFDRRVVAAEHRPERAGTRRTFVNAGLVKIMAEHVDAVRSAQIKEPVTVEIGDHQAVRRLQKRTAFQMLAHMAAELERHAVGCRELQIGNALCRLRGQRRGFSVALAVQLREPHKRGPAPRRDFDRCAIAVEKTRLVVLVIGRQRRDPARHARMARQRRVFGFRQLETRLELRQSHGRRYRTQRVHDQGFVHRYPLSIIYLIQFTN